MEVKISTESKTFWKWANIYYLGIIYNQYSACLKFHFEFLNASEMWIIKAVYKNGNDARMKPSFWAFKGPVRTI